MRASPNRSIDLLALDPLVRATYRARASTPGGLAFTDMPTDQVLGFWSVTAEPRVLDAAGSAGPDFICIDTQHGVDIGRLDVATFDTLAYYGVPGLVRVEANHETPIGRALDLGAAGVVVPMVESADDAIRAVAACLPAPEGTRSYGVQTRRHDPPERPICWIQIETAGAMDALETIASVDGVDALYVGPADLGLALGGEPASDVESVFDGTHPNAETMRLAFERVVSACARADIYAGLHCGNGSAAARAIERGFQIAAVGADISLLAVALERELATAREAG